MTDSRQDTTLSMPSINEAEEEEENPNEEEVNPSPTLQKEMAELMKPRKNLVNVHQFFPQLEHQFSQSSSKFEEEQDRRAEVAIKEIVAETTSSTIVPDDKQKSQLDSLKVENSMEGGQLVTVAIEKEIPNEDAKAEGDYTIDSSTNDKQNQNNSAPKKSVVFIGHDIEHKEENPASVFATAVSEDTIAKARRRQSSIFQTQDWGPVDNYSPSMNEIIQHKADQHFKMAMECKEKGDYEQTIIYINKALGLRKEDHRYFVERAEAYIQLCDFKSAILNYKRACLLEPDNEEYYHRLSFLYYFLGQTLFDQRLYPEALECFSSAAEMNPNNVGYHIRSITCLAALHRHGECLALVNKRLETETENPDLYIMRARLHEMFRNTTLCYYDVKDALGLNPDHKEAKAMMLTLEKRAKDNKMQALQLNLAGKHREALHKISISIETNPNVADFHVLRGALHRKLGDFNAAIDDFLLALDKCDHNEESPVYIDSQRQLLLTYNDFAVECFTKGFYDEAIILLNKAIKGEKREKGLYVNRGDCFFRQNDFNFALQDYTQALELDPSDEAVRARMSVIYNEHGVTAYQEKNYSEAESKFNQAIHYNAKVGQYYISRARARYMLENMTGARQDLLMGLLLDPSNEDVISILSRLFPGKSVADVVNSRAADTAKNALKQVLYPPSRQATRSGTNMETLVGSDRGFDVLPSSARKPWSAEKTGASEDSCDSFVLESKSIPNLKYCMKEQDFNIKLVEVKKSVHEDVKDALINRKTLRYDGPRVQPLPPPMPKPRYGGLRKEHLIKNPSSGDKNKKSTNWKQFTSGIGVPQALDV